MKKTVLITGATTGIGKATAFAFGKKDYNVVFTSRNKTRGEAFFKRVKRKRCREHFS
jgi:short-subunit dehydrogenase